ncbi:MAG: AAA family ATPase [Oscillochloridaceae bacterium umkhey_bin13]
MEAVLFVGIQAAGKSTFYRERFFTTHLRISLDLLRTRHRERSLLAWCIAHRQRFVVDNTNPRVAERAVYIAPAKAAGFRVLGYVFESHVPASITRNAGRAPVEQVPAQAIGGTKKRMEWPQRDEGFDALHYVRIDPTGGFSVEEWHDAV